VWSHDGIPRSALGEVPLLGLKGTRIAVADSYLAGQYGSVYVDTDRDGDLSDEKALEKFSNSHQFAPIQVGAGVLSVAVAQIEDVGGSVTSF